MNRKSDFANDTLTILTKTNYLRISLTKGL